MESCLFKHRVSYKRNCVINYRPFVHINNELGLRLESIVAAPSNYVSQVHHHTAMKLSDPLRQITTDIHGAIWYEKY